MAVLLPLWGRSALSVLRSYDWMRKLLCKQNTQSIPLAVYASSRSLKLEWKLFLIPMRYDRHMSGPSNDTQKSPTCIPSTTTLPPLNKHITSRSPSQIFLFVFHPQLLPPYEGTDMLVLQAYNSRDSTAVPTSACHWSPKVVDGVTMNFITEDCHSRTCN